MLTLLVVVSIIGLAVQFLLLRKASTALRTDLDRLHQAGTDALQTVAAAIAAETRR